MDTDVLNDGDAGVPPAGLAAGLRYRALELKSRFYDPACRRMDYGSAAASAEFEKFVRLARSLREFDLSSLKSRQEKLAFWINLYNALTVHAVIALKPRRSVWDARGFFHRAAYDVGGCRFSLSDIENGVLRANRPGPYSWRRPFTARDPRRSFALTDQEFDPRIHFALNCGSRSCPPIAFYDPGKLDEQLELAARSFIQGETGIVGDRVVTSPIFKWYRGDFGSSLSAFLARYLPSEVAEDLKRKRIAFSRYDWSLNR